MPHPNVTSLFRAQSLLPIGLGCALMSFSGTPVIAADIHGAHVHGVGKLNVALEGDGVWLEIEAPAADIVGFEHPPETSEQHAAVDQAAATLRDGGRLFIFPEAARCALAETTLESALLEHGAGHEHDEAAHAEFHARYVFRCERPDRASHVDVAYFQAFPAAEELDVTVISPNGQTATELTPSSKRLKL